MDTRRSTSKPQQSDSSFQLLYKPLNPIYLPRSSKSLYLIHKRTDIYSSLDRSSIIADDILTTQMIQPCFMGESHIMMSRCKPTKRKCPPDLTLRKRRKNTCSRKINVSQEGLLQRQSCGCRLLNLTHIFHIRATDKEHYPTRCSLLLIFLADGCN
ncbi:hypothetical protein H5410_037955 [Solanum commersonii]|uniref:Uncharacterized protein n=1 Tax=Solanum commersonii TaxID=4109 RepID=A0A9J5Y7P1_SOLCO|nr:hypothetical protein H5410_037955 [Solanum commersonii]